LLRAIEWRTNIHISINQKVKESVKSSRRFKFWDRLARFVRKLSRVVHYVKNMWRNLDKFGFLIKAWQQGREEVETAFSVNEAADYALFTAAREGNLIDFDNMSKAQIQYLLNYFHVRC
jgi:hypothetical protein